MEAMGHNDKRDHHTREIVVNGRSISITNAKPTGSEILAEAGFEPVDEHVLIEREKIGSRLISLDQRIEIHGGGEVARFYAFRTGEVFTFTVNDHGFQWGKKIITETEIREIARVAEEDVLVLDRGNDEPQILQASDKVELCSTGTEHLRTERRLVKVFIDNVEKEIPRGFYTTEELISILKVQAGYLLNLATNDGLELLKPGQRIHVKDGMRFFSQVPGGGAS
jgi:hypothetical protein